MIGVLVVTDNIKEWEDKFQACMKFTSERRDIYSNEFYFKNEVFSIYIVKSVKYLPFRSPSKLPCLKDV